jgi:hypothetical protein
MKAPENFALWTSTHVANDKKFGRSVFRYHPRSDGHSKKLCSFVIEDLLAESEKIRGCAQQGSIVGGINYPFTFPNGKSKNLDLAVGTPAEPEVPSLLDDSLIRAKISRLLLACEAKQCMTEHSKTKPRIFDELSSSHEIVHQGDTEAIAAGIVVVNVAERYASPTRQLSGEAPLVFTQHRQPFVTESMVNHLKGLIMREKPGEVGFDAFAVIVVDCDNVGECRLHLDPPAPQPGDPHHYSTFLTKIIAAFEERFLG